MKERLKKTSKSERSQLSHLTIAHRLQDLSNNIKDRLIYNLKNCNYFSLALHEPYDLKHCLLIPGIFVSQRTSKIIKKSY